MVHTALRTLIALGPFFSGTEHWLQKVPVTNEILMSNIDVLFPHFVKAF